MRLVDIVPPQILGWGATKMPLLCSNLFNQYQFISCKGRIFRRFDVIQNLLRTGSSSQHTGHDTVVQNPGQHHLRQGLASPSCQIAQCPNLANPLPSFSVTSFISSLYLASKQSEIYFRKIRSRTTDLYSEASKLPRRTQAASQICFSKPMSLVLFIITCKNPIHIGK